jgi:hypothetical protein
MLRPTGMPPPLLSETAYLFNMVSGGLHYGAFRTGTQLDSWLWTPCTVCWRVWLKPSSTNI